jgi:hypothetical protein
MFGSKRRQEERMNALKRELQKENAREASRRPTLTGAIHEVLDSTEDVLLRTPGAEVSGAQGHCTIGLRKEYSTEHVVKDWTEIKNTFGELYACTISVTAMCPTAATQMRTMLGDWGHTYRDEEKPVHHSFNSIAELRRWTTSDGRITNSPRYAIHLTSRASLENKVSLEKL